MAEINASVRISGDDCVELLRWLLGLGPGRGGLKVTSLGQGRVFGGVPLFNQRITIGDGPARFKFQGVHNGAAVPVDGPFTVEIGDPSLLSVAVDATDPSVFVFQDLGNVGTCQVTVSADVRLGPDVLTKSNAFTIEIGTAEADTLDVSFLGQGDVVPAAPVDPAAVPTAPT